MITITITPLKLAVFVIAAMLLIATAIRFTAVYGLPN